MEPIVNPKIDRYKTFLDFCREHGSVNGAPRVIVASEPLFSKILQWCKWYTMSNVYTDHYIQFDQKIEDKLIRVKLEPGETRLKEISLKKIKGENWL